MKRKFNGFLLAGMIGCFTFGSHFATRLLELRMEDRNIWWTHSEMKLNLEETRNSFELWIDGKLLRRAIERGDLYIVNSAGQKEKLGPGDVKARVNNYREHENSILKFAILSAFGSGFSLAFLLVGIFYRKIIRMETEEVHGRG